MARIDCQMRRDMNIHKHVRELVRVTLPAELRRASMSYEEGRPSCCLKHDQNMAPSVGQHLQTRGLQLGKMQEHCLISATGHHRWLQGQLLPPSTLSSVSGAGRCVAATCQNPTPDCCAERRVRVLGGRLTCKTAIGARCGAASPAHSAFQHFFVCLRASTLFTTMCKIL